MDVTVAHGESDSKLEEVQIEEIRNKKLDTDMNYRHKYIWKRVVVHAAIQTSGIIGLYTLIFYARWATIVWAICIIFSMNQGVVLGAHRCFTHKSFKVTTPLKVLFILFQTMAGQNSILTWVRDHRLHHKYSDTDADPHNSRRGFFFSHMVWVLTESHPLVIEKQKQIDVSDLYADKMIMFQYKYFLHLYFVIAVIFPISMPIYFWNETLWSSFFVAYCFAYTFVLHQTLCINSFAHLLGSKTYDTRIGARQVPFVSSSFLIGSEGWHNYHHVFPWDCRSSEYGQRRDIFTSLLDIFAYLGLAYDLKTASPRVIFGHMKRHGDGSETGVLAEYEGRKTQEAMEELPKKL